MIYYVAPIYNIVLIICYNIIYICTHTCSVSQKNPNTVGKSYFTPLSCRHQLRFNFVTLYHFSLTQFF